MVVLCYIVASFHTSGSVVFVRTMKISFRICFLFVADRVVESEHRAVVGLQTSTSNPFHNGEFTDPEFEDDHSIQPANGASTEAASKEKTMETGDSSKVSFSLGHFVKHVVGLILAHMSLELWPNVNPKIFLPTIKG